MNSKAKPCSKFKCVDLDTCEYCYNGNCTGHGFNGYTHCGCDLCEYNHVCGPFITCDKEKEEYREEIYDWDEEYDPIINP